MNKLKIIFFIIIFSYLFLNNSSHAAINFTVSPIKFELDTQTWSTIFETAMIRNNGSTWVTLKTTKTDFQANWSTWVPNIVRKSELVYPDQELSTWITINIDEFTILPGEEKEIQFAIQVPNDASPWWHYWAVCFKNNNSEGSTTWNVAINVDYCILVLINVDWEIVTEWDVWDADITGWGWWWTWWWWWESAQEPDDCPFVDLTASRYDWKCIDNFFDDDDEIDENIDDLNLDDEENQNPDDFNINFEIPFINEWNTHLVPEWQITLIDEDWNQIKWVWKELIKNEHWAVIWEKVVDYLPINDDQWNVLPGQERKFDIEWKWFPYEGYDENWKQVIKYWTPEEYYSRKNIDDIWYLMPWERINERVNHEKVNAYIDISYFNKDWELVEFSSAEEFYIDYKERYVWLNPYAFICAWLFIIVVAFLWLLLLILLRKKRINCINCEEKLKEDMKICPYCGTKQNDKRVKKKKKKKS